MADNPDPITAAFERTATLLTAGREIVDLMAKVHGAGGDLLVANTLLSAAVRAYGEAMGWEHVADWLRAGADGVVASLAGEGEVHPTTQ